MEEAVIWALISIAATLFTYWLGRRHSNSHTEEIRANNRKLEAYNQVLEANNQVLLEYNEKLSKLLDTVGTLKGDEEARGIVERYGQASQALRQNKKSLQHVREQEKHERWPTYKRNIGFHHRIMDLEEQLKRGPEAFMPQDPK